MKDSRAWDSLAALLAALGLQGSPRRVLVVEDESAVREGLVRALAGHDVDAREGLERTDLPLTGYDAAILDNYFLSNSLTGTALVPELRRSCPQIQILAISSDAGKNAEMVRLGANLAVAKSALRRLL